MEISQWEKEDSVPAATAAGRRSPVSRSGDLRPAACPMHRLSQRISFPGACAMAGTFSGEQT